MNELYWYDHLEAANKKCRLTGDDETFTADEVEAIFGAIESKHNQYEKTVRAMTMESAMLNERIIELNKKIAQRDGVIQKLEEENKLLRNQVEQLSTINERYMAVVKALVEDGVDTGSILFGNDGAEKAAERIMQIADQALNKMSESRSPHDQETAG